MPSPELVPIDPALLAQQPQPTQPELEPNAVEWMLICFAHDEQLFRDARQLISAHHFAPHEEPLKILYLALCEALETIGGYTYDSLAFMVEQMVAAKGAYVLTPEQVDIMLRPNENGLLWNVCYPAAEMMNPINFSYARVLLKRFVHERTVVAPLRRMLNPGFNAGIPANLNEFLEAVDHQQARLSTLDALPLHDVVPEIGTLLRVPFEFRPTGLPFIDVPLNGQRVGDCNGIVGITGGGKTTLGLHLSVSCAHQSWTHAIRNNKKPGLSVYITYEEAAIKLRPRIWSAAFQLPRDTCETMADWNALSPHVKDSDRLLQGLNGKDLGDDVLSELERYRVGREWLTSSYKLLDLSGSDEHPYAGSGGVPEMISYLDRMQQSWGQEIDTVTIDYAGLAVERYLSSMGMMDEKRYRLSLKRFGDEVRKGIAERFGCTVWCLHQLKGDLGKASPTKQLHHSDSSESKDFAVNMSICGVLGNPDQRTGCRALWWTKIRYRPNEQLPPCTLKIGNNLAIMVDVTNLFVPQGPGFLTLAEANEVVAHGAQQRQERQASGGPNPAIEQRVSDGNFDDVN